MSAMRLLLFSLAGASLFLIAAGAGPEELDLPSDADSSVWTEADKLQLSANRKFAKALKVAQADYRERLATIISKADRVQLCLLHPELSQDKASVQEAERFWVLPYRKFARILKTLDLPQEASLRARSSLSALLRVRDDAEGGAWCHEPRYGIRVFAGDRVVFSTSLCWKCQNYFVSYPNDDEGSASWVGLPSSSTMEAEFKRLLPIPPELKQSEDNRSK